MLNQDYTAKILNLEDVIIKNVENKSDKLFIRIELPRKAHVCPDCGRRTDHVHDYREQVIKDIPLGRDTFLLLRKRAIVAPAASVSLRKTPSCLVITVSPIGWCVQ